MTTETDRSSEDEAIEQGDEADVAPGEAWRRGKGMK